MDSDDSVLHNFYLASFQVGQQVGQQATSIEKRCYKGTSLLHDVLM